MEPKLLFIASSHCQIYLTFFLVRCTLAKSGGSEVNTSRVMHLDVPAASPAKTRR